MVKLRLIGEPKEVEAFIETLNSKVDVLDQSRSYSSYEDEKKVRVYLLCDVPKE